MKVNEIKVSELFTWGGHLYVKLNDKIISDNLYGSQEVVLLIPSRKHLYPRETYPKIVNFSCINDCQLVEVSFPDLGTRTMFGCGDDNWEKYFMECIKIKSNREYWQNYDLEIIYETGE